MHFSHYTAALIYLIALGNACLPRVYAEHAQFQHGRDLLESTEPWIEVLSWKPRAFLYHNFLTPEECDHVVELAKPHMARSTVVGDKGQSVTDSIRTSYGTFLARYQDDVIGDIQERVSAWTKLPVSHQEDMQVLRYALGQEYGAHYDSLDNDSPRIATVLLYLRDTVEGGETAFPASNQWIDPALRDRMGPFSDCAKDSVAAKPKKGDALLFFSLKTDGQHDSASLHAGCPVVKGTKLTGTIWIHTVPFRPETLGNTRTVEQDIDPESCTNELAQCKEWAEAGECEKNPPYMIGDPFRLGNCRLACKVCETCRSDDYDCRSRNRVNAGFLSLEEMWETN